MDDLVEYVANNTDEGSDDRETLTDFINTVLNADTEDEVEEIYDEYNTDETGASVNAATAASNTVQALVQSCPILAPGDFLMKQQDCSWAQVSGSYGQQTKNETRVGFQQRGLGFTGGLQREVADDWFVEVAGIFEYLWRDGSNFSQYGYQLSSAVALKREIGDTTLSTTINGGFYHYDASRQYTVGSSCYAANSDHDGYFAGAEIRAAHLLKAGQFYAKPFAALAIHQVWQNEYTEDGDGPQNWAVDPISNTNVTARAGIELGKAFRIREHWATIYARLGTIGYLTNPDMTIQSRLQGLDSSPVLSSTSGSDRLLGELDLGLNVNLTDRLSLTAQGMSTFSDESYNIGGYARLKLQF